jgi:hypothetical protein
MKLDCMERLLLCTFMSVQSDYLVFNENETFDTFNTRSDYHTHKMSAIK